MQETKSLVGTSMITTLNLEKPMKVAEMTVISTEILQLMKVLEEPGNLTSKEL
jgi:hypothetical protein